MSSSFVYLQVGPDDGHIINIKAGHYYIFFNNLDVEALIRFTNSISIATNNPVKFLLPEF